jgi:hypothetical protein
MSGLLSAFILAAGTLTMPFDLSTPALCTGAPAPVEQSIGGPVRNAVCTADCGSFTDVSCSAPTCSAVNRSCPGEQGHVTCGTTTYYCPACTSECTNGQTKIVPGPMCGCEDGMSTPKDHYLCVDGQWEYQNTTCGGPFCHG